MLAPATEAGPLSVTSWQAAENTAAGGAVRVVFAADGRERVAQLYRLTMGQPFVQTEAFAGVAGSPSA